MARKSCQLMHDETCGTDNRSRFGIVVVVQNGSRWVGFQSESRFEAEGEFCASGMRPQVNNQAIRENLILVDPQPDSFIARSNEARSTSAPQNNP